ncbi:hypothetical protein [Synechococcus sp. MU1650]|nr:hypothetical protein [Synechococcus sp. MU1650]
MSSPSQADPKALLESGELTPDHPVVQKVAQDAFIKMINTQKWNDGAKREFWGFNKCQDQDVTEYYGIGNTITKKRFICTNGWVRATDPRGVYVCKTNAALWYKTTTFEFYPSNLSCRWMN